MREIVRAINSKCFFVILILAPIPLLVAFLEKPEHFGLCLGLSADTFRVLAFGPGRTRASLMPRLGQRLVDSGDLFANEDLF